MAKSKGKVPPQLAAHQFTKGSAKAKKAGTKGGKVSPTLTPAKRPTPKRGK